MCLLCVYTVGIGWVYRGYSVPRMCSSIAFGVAGDGFKVESLKFKVESGTIWWVWAEFEGALIGEGGLGVENGVFLG